MTLVVLFGVMGFVLFVFAASSIKIIRPYQRGLVERLGRYHATEEPGLRIIVPVIDRMVRVDMREVVLDVPPQEVITSDNVVVRVDAVIYYEATDPQRLIYNVTNFQIAVTKLAQTNLRNVIGDMQLDEALTSSEIINSRLRDILDDATDKWGTRVVRVEIQRIDPPPDVVESMHHQMRAERTRRAVVTEAAGTREAAVTQAEGEKTAAILKAQGDAEATKASADAERFRQDTVAQGEAEAIRTVYKAIHDGGPSNDLLAIKYMETLQIMANGQATKIFLPTEATALLGALAGVSDLFQERGNGAGKAKVARARRPTPSS
ncbi:MAG TPA: SPFH domain-containing protein [Acidimicrobiales bacterium]|nr:SPFH domain-containing protein [Acidimicrobiales bacterium]